MEMHAEGLRHNPHPMLIDDADKPAKWYFQLKARASDEASDPRSIHTEVAKLKRSVLTSRSAA